MDNYTGEWWPPDYGASAVEFPSEIVSLLQVNGRLFVTLIDGRVIDMTDWFAAPDRSN